MSSDAVWGTVVGLLMVVIIGLSIAIYYYRRESQKYQAANATGEGQEMQATSEENQVSNTTLDDIELGAIGDATETTVVTTDAARDVGNAAIETTDKKEEITMKFQDEKNDSGDSNDSSDESENTFVVHSSQKSIQSPLAIYNDLKRRFSLSFAASAASAAGQTTTYIPGVTSGDKNNNNNNDSKDIKSDNGNGKGKGKGLKENLLLSSKNGEAKEKASKVRARQSSMPAPSACRITRYHARLPSKIFLENKLKRLSITTANKTLNGDEDVIDVYSVSGKEEKEKQGEAGDGKENKKQNDKKQDGKNKIENGSSDKPAKNNNNNNSEKPFPKITIVTNVSSLGKPDKEKEKATPLISTPQTTIINPTPRSPVIIVTPSGARTRGSVEDEELNEENVSLNGIVSGVVVGIDRRRRSSTNSFSFSSGYSSSPDLAETLTELPSNGPPTGNDVLINNILARKSESETKNSNSGGGIAKDKVKGKDLQTEKRSSNQYVFEDRKDSTNKKTIKTGKSKAKAKVNGKVGKSNKPKELASIVTQKQHGERQGRARKESSIGRGSPLRRQRERRVGLPKRVKSPLVGSSQRNSRNNSRRNSRNSRNSITLQISNDFDIDDDGEHSSICDGWDRTKTPRVAAQPTLVQSPFYNTGNDKSSKKMIKKSEIMSSKTPVIEISKKFQSNARGKNVKTDKMGSLGRVTRTTRSVTPKKCKCHQDCNHNGKNGKRVSRNTVRGAGTGGNDGKKRTGSKKIGKNENGKSKNGESKSHRQSVSLSPNRPRKSKGKKENLVAIDFKKQAKSIKTGVNDENNGNLNRPQWF